MADIAGNRYLVTEEHARGGMGVVSRAHDQELGRDVALKEMKPEFAGSPKARKRFVTEGEVTGRLEHPGIVPVYGLGSFNDGRPFYAMRFIQGESLLESIRKFHAQPNVSFTSLAIRNLLKRFVDACNAVAFAHDRGYIHRDLKPANIMLGPFGETLVVDWGLAKLVGGTQLAESAGNPIHDDNPASESDATAAYLPEPNPHSTAANDQTQLGQAVGTLAYMPPEQAEGRWDIVGTPADVYSLGASLYEILAGRPPFQGTRQEVFASVLTNAFTPPRSLNKNVPAALDAICRKAMAKHPEDRYGSVLQLVGDIDRWLADEPVSSYREPLWARVRRWGRRHRTLTTSLFLLFVTITLGIGIGLIVVNEERKAKTEAYRLEHLALNSHKQSLANEKTAREAAQKALDAELKALNAARSALDATTDDLVGKVLGRQGPLGNLEREFLQKLLKAYASFEADIESRPQARRLSAQSQLRIAKILQRLGDHRASADGFRKAIAGYKAVNDPMLRGELAESMLGFARAHIGFSAAEALPVLKEGMELREALFLEQKTVRAHQELATAILDGAEAMYAVGEKAAAEKLYHQLIRTYQPLLLKGQLGLEAAEAIAKAYDQLAFAAENRKPPDLAEAYRFLDNAVVVFGVLNEAAPDEPRYRYLHLLARSSRAAILRKDNKPDEAEMHLKSVVVEFRALVDMNPGVRDYRHGLASALVNQAVTLQQRKQMQQSIPPLEDAWKLLLTLSRQFPDYDVYRENAQSIAAELIRLYDTFNRSEDAKRLRSEIDKISIQKKP